MEGKDVSVTADRVAVSTTDSALDRICILGQLQRIVTASAVARLVVVSSFLLGVTDMSVHQLQGDHAPNGSAERAVCDHNAWMLQLAGLTTPSTRASGLHPTSTTPTSRMTLSCTCRKTSSTSASNCGRSGIGWLISWFVNVLQTPTNSCRHHIQLQATHRVGSKPWLGGSTCAGHRVLVMVVFGVCMQSDLPSKVVDCLALR